MEVLPVLVLPVFLLLWWVTAARLLGDIAERRGNSSRRFFWIGLMFGPIVGVAFLIAMPRGDTW
jgi:hypothetical protein